MSQAAVVSIARLACTFRVLAIVIDHNNVLERFKRHPKAFVEVFRPFRELVSSMGEVGETGGIHKSWETT